MFENIQDSGQTAGNVLLGIQGGIKHSTAHITSNEAKIKKEGVHNEGARMPSSVEIRVPSQRDLRQENNEDDKSKNHTSPQPSVAQQDHMNASSLDVSKETASQKQEEMARNTRAMDLVFDNFEIKWEDLILRERIGAGNLFLLLSYKNENSTAFLTSFAKLFTWPQGPLEKCIVLIGMDL